MFAYQVAELARLADRRRGLGRGRSARAVPRPPRAVRDAVNATTAPPSGDNLVDGFFRNAAATPGGHRAHRRRRRHLTLRRTEDQVLSVAAALQSRGVGSAATSWRCMGPKGAEQIPALLGILDRRCGAICRSASTSPPTARAASSATGGVEFALVSGTEYPTSSTTAGVPSVAARIAEIDTAASTVSRPITVAPGRSGLRAVHLRLHR